MEGIDQPRLEIRTSAVGDELCIEVADNGTGIAPENLSRIAEPFFTTKPVGKGTGLGLSISFRLVERHGGRCEVQSTPGQGSRFLIHLPRSCARESPPPIIPNSESAGGE
jgi:signal transduction histidine kinase